MHENIQDVLIIGGGPAGLTAALYLGRARKSVVVLDAGDPRHAVSSGVHNFLTREGIAPAKLRTIAWEQMRAYPSVRHQRTRIVSLERADDLWIAKTQDAEILRGRAALLATGVIDEHPDIPGFQERWGHSIHHCPYCHGWEMRDQPLAIMAASPIVGHMAPLFRAWSEDIVVLTNGEEISDEDRARLGSLDIPIHEARVERLTGPGQELATIELEGGAVLARQGLFVAAPQRQVPLVDALGLELDEMGYIKVDPTGLTSEPMLWAAGDLTTRMQQVVLAAAQGAHAGTSINAMLTL